MFGELWLPYWLLARALPPVFSNKPGRRNILLPWFAQVNLLSLLIFC